MSRFVVIGTPTHVPEGTPNWVYCVIHEGDDWFEATRIYLNESSLVDGSYRGVRLLCTVDVKLEVGDLR